MVPLEKIKILADEIVRQFQPEKIILFGSHARGEAGKDSDVDLLVLTSYEGHSLDKAAEILGKTHPLEYSVDLIVRSPQEFERRCQTQDWLMRTIQDEGLVLYAT
jgi:uncharacterized protein